MRQANVCALKEAALCYGVRGWRVFPVKTRTKDHPLLKEWPRRATTDPTTIEQWWTDWPDANIGLATGPEVTVLDIDPRHGGDEALRDLEAKHGPLPETVQVSTGSGGTHYYFLVPAGETVCNSAGKLGTGLDVRGVGGYVLAPPSLHPTGGRYIWEVAHHPDDVPCEPMPAWMIRLLSDPSANAAASHANGKIPAGQRNDTLYRLARSLKLKRLSGKAIEAALLEENAAKCEPPLPDQEVRAIAEHAWTQPDRERPLIPSAGAAQLHTLPGLAHGPNILAQFAEAVRACGVVGEERNAQLIYLAVTSRLLQEPVSLALKGASSSGKSYVTQCTLQFFPKAAYIEMTAMSERALVYTKEEFRHRTLVIFEAVALREQREKHESNLTAYFVRSLLSEGRICYPVTVRDNHGGFITKTIVKEGPTNMILTTTATQLHGENETRIISLPTNDSAEQTRAVLLKLADGSSPTIDFQEWHNFQDWLTKAEHRVFIPFARFLAERIPPVAVRLRRDFKAILRLVETHAILHQHSRERDEDGRIIATEVDYLTVRDLVADLIAEGVGATVPPRVRETVEAVRALDLGQGVIIKAVAERLRLDRSATQRPSKPRGSEGIS